MAPAPGTELILLVAGLHLLGMALAGVLIIAVVRGEDTRESPRPDGDDSGGSDRLPPRTPVRPRDGGLPLPDARPAPVRLRDHTRLADLLPPAPRRPAHAPEREPARAPARGPRRGT